MLDLRLAKKLNIKNVWLIGRGTFSIPMLQQPRTQRVNCVTRVPIPITWNDDLASEGRRNEAEPILKKLETSKEYVSPAELAILYVGLGEKEKALSSLERAYAAHDLRLGFVGSDPHYDSVRSEPRFQELIRKVGLPG